MRLGSNPLRGSVELSSEHHGQPAPLSARFEGTLVVGQAWYRVSWISSLLVFPAILLATAALFDLATAGRWFGGALALGVAFWLAWCAYTLSGPVRTALWGGVRVDRDGLQVRAPNLESLHWSSVGKIELASPLELFDAGLGSFVRRAMAWGVRALSGRIGALSRPMPSQLHVIRHFELRDGSSVAAGWQRHLGGALPTVIAAIVAHAHAAGVIVDDPDPKALAEMLEQ